MFAVLKLRQYGANSGSSYYRIFTNALLAIRKSVLEAKIQRHKRQGLGVSLTLRRSWKQISSMALPTIYPFPLIPSLRFRLAIYFICYGLFATHFAYLKNTLSVLLSMGLRYTYTYDYYVFR